MRDALTISFAVTGIALFIAGDALWLIRRRRGRAMDLRVTGTLIAAGIALYLFASIVLHQS